MRKRGMKILPLFCFLFVLGKGMTAAESHTLVSPDKKIRVEISVQEKILYSVWHDSRMLIAPSPLSMSVRGYGVLGDNPTLLKVEHRSVDEILHPAVRVKSSEIRNHFNEITLRFEGPFLIDFRAFDDGVAYRFRTGYEGPIQVMSEEVQLNFAGDFPVYFPEEESFLTHSERLYAYLRPSEISSSRMASLPVLVDVPDGPKIAITEADLQDYPGLYLRGGSNISLGGIFPAAALKEEQTRDRTVRVVERADYLAQTPGERTYPWRVLVIAAKDTGLIESQMVYKLAPPLQIKDASWIKPGKVAWDWWNANNLFGVDFKAGVNTKTYKAFIDFASQYKIEYVILDEGWYELGDLFKINPEIDMAELLSYAREKEVGVILWVVWKTLDDQLEEALDQYQKWGVKGIKVDFMQRDDQWMVNYYWKIAREAAKRKLLVDFHGAYKPTGLSRAFPNVITREGVKGLENSKWSNQPTPEHNLTIPFTRMLAGPMDYTPGAMINAQEKNFRPLFDRPMSMGTRCHQLAMYVVYESPLQMLADSPSHYLREPECMEFLSRVPTVWDETRVLAAEVADYVVIARRRGEEWYVGAMTDWTARDLSVDFSFLAPGEYKIEIFRDGINADRFGSDYKKSVGKVSPADRLNIRLAPGGGWAARIWKHAAEGASHR